MSDYAYESAQPLLDQATIDEMKGVMKAKFGMMVDGFLEDAVMYIAAIKTIQDGGDWEEATRAAHSLKSSSAAMGLWRLSSLSKAVELTLKGNADTAAALVAAIPLITLFDDVYSQSEAALRAQVV